MYVAGHMRNISLKLFCNRAIGLGEDVFSRFFFYFQLLLSFCSVEQNEFCDFGRRPPTGHFCKIILKSVYMSRRRCHLFFFQVLALVAI